MNTTPRPTTPTKLDLPPNFWHYFLVFLMLLWGIGSYWYLSRRPASSQTPAPQSVIVLDSNYGLILSNLVYLNSNNLPVIKSNSNSTNMIFKKRVGSTNYYEIDIRVTGVIKTKS
jgi:hypothetical protein